MVALSALNNPSNQVQAAQVEWQTPVNYDKACVDGCLFTHSVAAQACCLGVYFPPAFVTCQLAASAALAACIYLCNQPPA